MKMKAALLAALMCCICFATSRAADCREILQKARGNFENGKLTWMGWEKPCRIDFEAKDSKFVNGIEDKSEASTTSCYFLQKDLLEYKLKIDDDNVVFHSGLYFYVVDASKQGREAPEGISEFLDVLISFFDAYHISTKFEDTVYTICSLLPEAKVEGRDCFSIMLTSSASNDTSVCYIDKQSYLPMKVSGAIFVDGYRLKISSIFDYTLNEKLGVFKKIVFEVEEGDKRSVTTFTTKKFELVDDLNEEEFNFKVIKEK